MPVATLADDTSVLLNVDISENLERIIENTVVDLNNKQQ